MKNKFKVIWLSTVFVAIVLLTLLSWRYGQILLLNADQLSDVLLFGSNDTLKGALFPSTHSFLLKWPIFYIIALLGAQPYQFIIVTVLMNLAVFLFFILLFRHITKEWKMSLLVMLAFLSTFILIPLEPHVGALLPLNFSMITTRNTEYIAFVFAILMLIRSKEKIGSIYFWLSAGVLSLLIASDRLFLSFSIGGAILMGVVALVLKKRQIIKPASMWLLNSIIAFFGAFIIIAIINLSKITSIGGVGASPYGLVSSVSQIAKAIFFALFDTASQFGANPLQVPLKQYLDQPGLLLNLGILFYALNAVIMIFGFYALYKVILNSKKDFSLYWRRAIIYLFFVCIVAYAVFVSTDHYYPVDGRYLSIIYLTVFMALALYARNVKISKKLYKYLLIALMAACIGSFATGYIVLDKNEQYYQPRIQSYEQAIKEMKTNNTSYVIGDYWDVMPLKVQSKSKINIVPTVNCTNQQTILSSSKWYKPILRNEPIAVLVGGAKTNITDVICTKAIYEQFYGKPTTIVDLPAQKQLLIYKNGVERLVHQGQANTYSNNVTIVKNNKNFCKNGKSVQIIAHQDDDLLFMNPDVQTDVKAQKCILTLYLTSGDPYGLPDYQQQREAGAKAAYSHMLGSKEDWKTDDLYYKDIHLKSYTNGRVRLVFYRVPDGGREGYGVNNKQSLQQLLDNNVESISSIDGLSTYTKDSLIGITRTIISTYKPNVIRTQAADLILKEDHGDHQAVNKLVQLSLTDTKYIKDIQYYLGYHVRILPVNLSPDQVQEKYATFLTYAKNDGAVCQSVHDCNKDFDFYGNFIHRQYVAPRQ